MTERTSDRMVPGASAQAFPGFGTVCGVGSVPHTEPDAAVELVARWAPEMPFWPQLRRRSPMESMIPQTLGRAFPLLHKISGEYGYAVPADRLDRFVATLRRDDVGMDAARAAGFEAFVRAFDRGAFPRARAVKGQMMGPVTIASSLYLDGQPLLRDPALRDLLLDYLVRLARWQTDALSRLHERVLLVFDEAYLGMAARAEPAAGGVLVELLRTAVLRVRRPNVLVGIHCCDAIPFEILASVQPDVYFFDAWNGAEAFCSDPHAARYVSEGGRLAWGWIPTLDRLSGVDHTRIVERWSQAMDQLSRQGIDPSCLFARSLLTASCGLGGSSLATCEQSFAMAEEVRRAFFDRMEMS